MLHESKPWTLSSILLVAAGATLVITGLYFILVRPPLLPEDVRYMALPAAQFDAVKPRLELWLPARLTIQRVRMLSDSIFYYRA